MEWWRGDKYRSSCFNCPSQIESIKTREELHQQPVSHPPFFRYYSEKHIILNGKKQDKYLQCFQANEACNSEAINDVFLAGHRLSLPPSRRPVPSESGPAFSPTRTQDTVRPTRLPIGAWGQGCGPLPGQVHSPSPPLPVSLRTGASALPEPGGSARALHVETAPSCSNSSGTKGTLVKFRFGGRHQTANQTPPHRPLTGSPVKMALMEPVAIIYRPLTTVYRHLCLSYGEILESFQSNWNADLDPQGSSQHQ